MFEGGVLWRYVLHDVLGIERRNFNKLAAGLLSGTIATSDHTSSGNNQSCEYRLKD